MAILDNNLNYKYIRINLHWKINDWMIRSSMANHEYWIAYLNYLILTYQWAYKTSILEKRVLSSFTRILSPTHFSTNFFAKVRIKCWAHCIELIDGLSFLLKIYWIATIIISALNSGHLLTSFILQSLLQLVLWMNSLLEFNLWW